MTLLTLGEASRRSGIGRRTLRQAVAEGRLPAERVDGWVYRIAPDDLASFALACEVERMSSSATRRAFEPQRPRSATPPAASAGGIGHWFRTLVASLRPEPVRPLR